jgi:Ran GTPase-activating protein (RanGAP) involved in mRNA processing and transport
MVNPPDNHNKRAAESSRDADQPPARPLRRHRAHSLGDTQVNQGSAQGSRQQASSLFAQIPRPQESDSEDEESVASVQSNQKAEINTPEEFDALFSDDSPTSKVAITNLKISCELNNAQVHALTQFTNLKTLTVEDTENNTFIKSLTGILPSLGSLERLDFYQVTLNAEGTQALSDVLILVQAQALAHDEVLGASLEVSQLRSCTVDTAAMQILIGRLPDTSIHEVILDSCDISSTSIEALANILPRKTIQVLSIKNMDLTTELMQTIASKVLDSHLITLDVGSNEIGDTGLRALSHVLARTPIQKLDLESNEIGVDGARVLGLALRRAGALEEVNLSRNSIGDQGAMVLATALPRSTLTKINLSECDIGDRGARRLVSGIQSGSKMQIILSNNNISDTVAQDIRHKHPNVEI